MSHGEEQFLRMVRENEGRLRRLCRIYAPDPDARRDLYQDILVQVWRALPGFRGESTGGTWLYRVALNTALAYRRSARWKLETQLEAGHLERSDLAAQPPDRVERAQSLGRHYAAIESLPDADKGLIMLYLDDVSYRNIAEILGISVSNVGVRLHRVRKRLGDRVGEEPA